MDSDLDRLYLCVIDWQEALQLQNRLCEFIQGLTVTRDGARKISYDDFLEIEQWRKHMNDVCRASQQEYARTAEDIPSEDDLEGWLEEDMADDAANEGGTSREAADGLGAGEARCVHCGLSCANVPDCDTSNFNRAHTIAL